MPLSLQKPVILLVTLEPNLSDGNLSLNLLRKVSGRFAFSAAKNFSVFSLSK